MLSERFERALVSAVRWHSGHLRKGGAIPYVSHLLSVSALVLEAGGSEDAAIGALLHDAVEDQKATLAEVEEAFGERVASIVDQCSDTDQDPKPPWQARKEAFVESIRTMSDDARLVVTADKLHNLRSILTDVRTLGAEVWEKFSGSRDGSLWYYRAVCDALSESGNPLTHDLEDAVRRLESLAGRELC